ncbi:putative FAD-linked oxidoreductase yvdP [Rhizoctonia solani AG-1 IB]|uniref:Putative FAD-linked oxidoreductase yvdP n=1 Tax=Thanatephorus cucumeris (strain AG1-IB / isolate 7/3/14) TaxID=1108050 RepID=M5C904_THACB|nr:putative FAD-linked oxidoreductase yvdP [Rhizoctonia solani AG-1 IB]
MLESLCQLSDPPTPEEADPTFQFFAECSASTKVLDRVPTANPPPLTSLEQDLPFGAMIYPGTLAYERGAFIGNLLYRLKTPASIVQPREIKDVVTIVNFCRTNKMPLTVKNGGHSYAGYCLNKGGIVMDMGAMIHVHINDNSTVATIQGGATWNHVYDKLLGKDKANIIIGGQCPKVGVSGFTLGGGLSPFSRSYGLGIDNVVEMTVVTADGEVVTVNDQETHPERQDLFWALRGGGGGNFGVLVEFKSKVHKLRRPDGKVVCGQLTWYLDKSLHRFGMMMDVFSKLDCPNELTIDAIWRVDKKHGRVGQMTVIYNGGRKECDEALEPLLQFNPDGNDLKEMDWSLWVDIENGFDVKSKVFHHHASFVFDKNALNHWLVDLINKLTQEAYTRFYLTGKGDSHFLWDHIGGRASEYKSTDTPFPWRDGVYVSTMKVKWNNEKDTSEMMDFILKCKRWLQPFTIQKKAAYLNYIDSTVDDWQHAYYGDNYPRLQEVKQKWDPNDFFRFDRSIELPNRTRRIAAIRPIPVSTGSQGVAWLLPTLDPSHFSPWVHGIRPLEHDIAHQTASERTLSLWAEYSMSISDFEGLNDDATKKEILTRIGIARAKRIQQEIEGIGPLK